MKKASKVISTILLVLYLITSTPFDIPFAIAEESEVPIPKINSIEPSVGSVNGGDTVRIFGENLNIVTKVFLGEIEATNISAITSEQIVVKTPARPDGAPGKVDVRLEYSVNEQINSVIYPNGFEYRTSVGITAITPIRGSVEGEVIATISGYNFPLDEKLIEVYFGEVKEDIDANKAKVLAVLDSQTIRIETPPSDAGSRKVSVTLIVKNEDGSIKETAVFDSYEYVEPISQPKLLKVYNTALGKPVGPVSGEVGITVYAYDFRQSESGENSGEGIFFGSQFLKLNINTVKDLTEEEKTEISKQIDPKDLKEDASSVDDVIDDIKVIRGVLEFPIPIEPGLYDVTLINPDGAIHQLPYYFQFRTTHMMIDSANPILIHKDGTEIRLIVRNLSQDEVENELWAFFLDSEGRIEQTIPVEKVLSRDGLHDVYIKTPELSSGLKNVYLQSVFGESNQIRIRVVEPDNIPIIHAIIGEDGTESWNKVPYPTIEDSARGPVTGGTDIVILGKNFSDSLDDPIKVLIDNVEATDIVVDIYESEEKDAEGNPIIYDRITAKTGPLVGELPGLKDVKVINPGGGDNRTGIFPKSFYYYSTPQITNVVPNKGRLAGGNIITIEGEQFYQGLKIYFEKEIEDHEGNPTLKSVEVSEYKLENNEKLVVRIPDLNELFPNGADLNKPVTIRIENIDKGTASWDKFRAHAPDDDVSIENLIPDKGPYSGGTRVTIIGKNFKIPKGRVYFGLEEAQIEKWSENEIIVITPAQPEAGEFDVDVTVINEDTSLAIKENGFHYNHPRTAPRIIGIFPNVGPTTGGTTITIKGSDFWSGAEVLIGAFPATDVKVINSETIIAKTGKASRNGVLQPGTYKVTVVNPDSSISEGNVYFTYENNDSEPEIESVNPLSGPTTGGAIIHIQGTDFRKGIKVYFDDLEAQIVRFEEAENPKENSDIWVRLPAWPANRTEREVIITVINTDGGVGQYGVEEGQKKFTYVDITSGSTPEIEEIIPSQGSLAGGTEVVITGDKFRAGAEVYFGHLKAEDVEVVRYDRIEVTTPPWTGELDRNGRAVVDVTVVNIGDSPGSVTQRNGFTYLATRPEIYAIAPDIGSYKGGDTAIITGKDFTEEVEVFIGDMKVAAPEVDVQNGKITIQTPSLEEAYPENYAEYLFKALDVKVINQDGEIAVLAEAFTYKHPDSNPKIFDVRPAKGSIAGGQPIEIIGEDFREVFDDKGNQLLYPKVIIGGKEATDVVFVSSKKLTCRIPPNNPGQARVIVINEDGGNAVWEHYFIYEEPKSEPKITSVVPNQGPDVGGTPVTIFGSDFRRGSSGEAPKVWFGNNQATDITWEAHNKITAITPEGVGTTDIIVVNPDMGQAILPKAFKYVKIPIPKVFSVTPDTGPDTGGTAIEIKGEEFAQGAEVYIGGYLATEIEVVDKNTIRAVTPPGEPGWQEVRVVNPDTGWGKLDNGFQYRGKPGEPGWFSASPEDYETIKLVWTRVDFANYYEIYVSNRADGTYRFLAQTEENYYYATNLDPGTRYYFKVRAVNEVGVSMMTSYKYATTDKRAPKRKQTEPDKIITATTNNTAEIMVPSLRALKNESYILDLTAQNLQKPVQKITFSAELLTDFNWNFNVLTPSFNLSVNPLSILFPQYWYSSSKNLEDVYSSLVITDLGQREAERALRQLPKGAKILSKVYSIGWELTEGRKVTPAHIFFANFQLDIDYKSADVPQGKTVDIFFYNDSLGKWEPAKATKNSYYTRLNINLIKPEKFVVVAY